MTDQATLPIVGCDPSYGEDGPVWRCSCPCGWWHTAWSRNRAVQVVQRHRRGAPCCVVKAHAAGPAQAPTTSGVAP